MHRLNVCTYGWTARHGAWRPAQRRTWLVILLACLIAAGSGLTLAPRPAAAQSTLICVNKTKANGLGNNYVMSVYAVGSTVYAATQGGLGISTDGGATFTNKTTANGLGDNDIYGVYAVGSTVYAATYVNGLSISTDGGATFTNKTTANGLGNNELHGVYAVGSTVYAATAGGLSISTDGGATFTNKTTANGLGDNTISDVYAVGSTVYAATYGGLSISTDGGATWTNKTLTNNFVNGVYVDGSTVYAGTYGGLGISTDGGATWANKTTANGLGGNTVLGVYAVGSTLYAATALGLSISTDSGATFTNKTTANGLGSNELRSVYAVGSTIYVGTYGGGLSICAPPQPVSQVQGSGVTITNGDATPSSADGTDFGYAVLGGTVAHTFALNNTGTLPLTLTGSPLVAVNGPNASDFTVTAQPASSVAIGGSTTFQLRFTPGAAGLRTATISIASNDSARNPYTFTVQGRSGADLNVQGKGVSIANGATPSSANGTDLGAVAVGDQRQQAFVLRNRGVADLTVSNLSFTGAHASDFSLVTPPSLPLTLAPNTSQTITVQLQPSAAGIRTANLTIASNDPTTPTYTLALQGGIQIPGAALDFDGIDDYVILPDTLNNQFAANQITVEGWFNPASAAGTDPSGWRGLVAEDWPGSGDVKFALFQVSSTVNCGFFNGSAWYWALNAPITINSWQHIACTYDQQALKLYVNGTQAASASVSGALPAGTGAWYLGRRWDATGYYQGRMDEVRIWNRALTQTEIQSNLNCEQPSSANGLIARYSFNQGVAFSDNSSVTTLTDSSANSLSGALTGFALTGASSTWVAPGGVTSGVSCSPKIAVQGNGVSIANGATPSTAAGTDLGAVAVGAQQQQAFVLRNAGFADLTVSNLSFTGAHASDFSLVTPPSLPLTLAPNTSQTITVQLQPSAAGIRTATLTIASNDPVTPSYKFGLQGGIQILGAALDFDGSNDYVALPATLNNQFAANRITVEGWFNPASAAGTAAAGWRGLVAEDYPGGGDVKFSLFQVGTTVNCGFYGGAWQWALNAPITLNTWQHIACTYDQHAIKLYVNGAQVASQAVSVALPAGTGAWYLGRRWDSAGYYQGRMDEVRIWNRALTQAEIQSSLNCEQPSNANGLVARYSFNQGIAFSDNSSVTTLTDSGANSLSGALTNFGLTGSASTWVAPGGVTSGVSCSPKIAVQGNGATITNGDSTPSSADNTDFGTVMVGSALTRTFTINNAGTAPLILSALAPTGGAASEFVVTGLSLPATIAASSSATFNVKFTPSATGLRTTTLSLTTNDSANNPYTFAVQGTGVKDLQPTSQLTQQGSYSYVGACTGSYPSRNCTLAFTLKNTSGGVLQVRYEQITAISNNVSVLNGAPSPGGVNTVVNDGQSVANNATFQPTFQLRLTSNVAYTLRFKVYGYAGSSVVAAGADQAQAVALGEFEATVTPDAVGRVNVFLPVIQR